MALYLFFFDSAKDKALNASLVTIMRSVNRIIGESKEREKQIDKVYQELAEYVEKKTGVDITESLEDALENSEKIEDIECTENSVKDISLISIHFVHKEMGPGTIRAYVKPPLFFEVERAELLAFDPDVQFHNGKTIPINLFLGDIYGFDEKGMEIFTSTFLLQPLKYLYR